MDTKASLALLLAAGAAALLTLQGTGVVTYAGDGDDGGDDGTGDSGGLIDWLSGGDGTDGSTDMTQASGGNRRAWLDMISMSEGTYGRGDNGYNIVVGGGSFSSYATHPRIVVQTKYGYSDAAGRYQIMAAVPGRITTNTWDWAHIAAGVSDFSPASQDAVALFLTKWRGALADVDAGNLSSAIAKCNKEWASLAGSPYGQNTNSVATLAGWFQQQGGMLA